VTLTPAAPTPTEWRRAGALMAEKQAEMA
jgi:hypothetical protein